MPDFENNVVDVKGLRNLDMMLAEMGKVAGFKALRGAMMVSSRPMLVAAKAAARATGLAGHDSDAMSAAMGRWVKKRGPKLTVLSIGPKNKNKKALAIYNDFHHTNYKRLNYFHLVEWGSVNGPAQPFMRPAFAATSRQMVAGFAKELGKSIDKIKRKHASQ